MDALRAMGLVQDGPAGPVVGGDGTTVILFDLRPRFYGDLVRTDPVYENGVEVGQVDTVVGAGWQDDIGAPPEVGVNIFGWTGDLPPEAAAIQIAVPARPRYTLSGIGIDRGDDVLP